MVNTKRQPFVGGIMDEYEIHLDDVVSDGDLDRHYRTRNKKYIYKRVISKDSF